MDKSLYYQNFQNGEEVEEFVSKLKAYAEKSTNGNPVYVINKPLGDNKYAYTYEKAMVILVPKYRVIFLNYGKNIDAYEDYVEDFLDDVGHISDKYNYLKVLGRPRNWKKDYVVQVEYDDIKDKKIEEFLAEYRLETKEKERKGEFLISLLTGSINNIEKTGVDYPETILEKIKRKIILFDGDQTRFIYDEPKQKKITIQGLAGTGKTELLLHKIKELYVKTDDIKIVFICHNKILADNLRERIPEFFDFMKVDEQIKWQEKLWVMSSWGSKGNPNSGVYSYICSYYDIPFERFSYNTTFDSICKRALENLRKIENFKPCFDYILIDESQDFTDSFFDLCSMVTRKCLYVAGDIFQNVFEQTDVSEVNPDFLLNKCYRTDPKTLMCAHAIGMGLFEENDMLRWLEDKAWEDCGYDYKKVDGYYDLYRRPLRRFEDLGNTGTKSIEIIVEDSDKYLNRVVSIIEELKNDNPTLQPEDIGIMFLENINRNYELANELQIAIGEKFDWDVNIGYETKEKRKGALFISNRNNVKGLEFPFVICIMQGTLGKDLQNRNSIYMMLTRTFITSYFVIPSDNNQEKIEKIVSGISQVNCSGYLHIKEPSEEKKKELKNAIIHRTNIYKSQREIVDEIMDEIRVNKKDREKMYKMINLLHKEELDREKLYEIIRINYSFMN